MYITNDKSVMLQPRHPPPFLSIPSVVLTGILLMALRRAGLLDADLKMDRVTADARSDHHWQPQPRRQSSA